METPTTTTAPPDAKPSAPSEAELRASLAGLSIDDMSRSVTPEIPPHATGADASTTAADPETETTKPDQTENQQKRDETGKFTKDEKSEERASKTWEEINAEKNRLAAERAEFDRQRQDFEAKAASLQDATAKASTTAEQYERYAKEWEAEGRDDLAATARDRAASLRNEARQVQSQADVAKFKQAQNAVIAQVVKENPDLAKPDSELVKTVDAILKRAPKLLEYPEGIRHAVEYAKAQSASGRVSALEKELAETKQRLAEREKLLQPARGGTSAPSGEVPFENLPTAEREKRLRAALQTADARGLVFAQ